MTYFQSSLKSCVAVALAVLILAGRASGQEEVVSREYAIKAGVLAVLGKCVTWPAGAAPTRRKPLKIGVLGKDPFLENGDNQLDRMVADEKSKGYEIEVMRFDSVEDYRYCHILFIAKGTAKHDESPAPAEQFAAIERAAGAAPVLLVGESEGLSQQGAVANLIFDRTSNLIQLEINPDAAARVGLKLAPGLLRLKLVQIVRDSKD